MFQVDSRRACHFCLSTSAVFVCSIRFLRRCLVDVSSFPPSQPSCRWAISLHVPNSCVTVVCGCVVTKHRLLFFFLCNSLQFSSPPLLWVAPCSNLLPGRILNILKNRQQHSVLFYKRQGCAIIAIISFKFDFEYAPLNSHTCQQQRLQRVAGRLLGGCWEVFLQVGRQHSSFRNDVPYYKS